MRLYIIRHADPDYPNGTITPDGHKEAVALAERMAGNGVDVIYSSPLGRALHTMEYTANFLKLPHEVLDWTQEISGMYKEQEGYGKFTPFNTPAEFILDQEPLPSHDDWFGRPYFEEVQLKHKIDEIRAGSDALMKRHGYERVGGRYRCIEPNDQKIAVFCHGGFGLTWIAHLLNLPLTLVWAGFWLAPTSVTTIFMDQRSHEWAVPRCIELGDTSHLRKSGLPVKLRGIWKGMLDGQMNANGGE